MVDKLMIGLETRILTEEDILQLGSEGMTREEQMIISTFGSVGIRHTFCGDPGFMGGPRLSRHFPSIGEFYFAGETVENWFFPEIGAMKLTRSILSAVRSGEVHLEGAREKIDGSEGIVFGIETMSQRVFFRWTTERIHQIDAKEPVAFEELNGRDVLISGNAQWCADHPWEVLSQGLIEAVDEGIIVRINCREYRVPRRLSATFLVKDSSVFLENVKITNILGTVGGEGLFDFERVEGKWLQGKFRPDKWKTDSVNGVKDMVLNAVVVDDLICLVRENVARKLLSPIVVIGEDFKLERTVGYNRGSVTTRVVEGMMVNRNNVGLYEANVFEVSGGPVVLPRVQGSLRLITERGNFLLESVQNDRSKLVYVRSDLVPNVEGQSIRMRNGYRYCRMHLWRKNEPNLDLAYLKETYWMVTPTWRHFDCICSRYLREETRQRRYGVWQIRPPIGYIRSVNLVSVPPKKMSICEKVDYR